MRIQEILEYLKEDGLPYTFVGDSEALVEGFSSLSRYKKGSFTWIKTEKNIPENFDLSQLALVFTGDETETGGALNVIRTPQSKRAFFAVIEHFYEAEDDRPAIGQFTYISPQVKLGKNVRIGHNCTLDGDITIGDDTVIWNNVTIINRVTIGKRCEIHSGAILGHNGLAYTEDENHVKKMIKHFGGISIGNDVQIGKGMCVDRGTIDDTVIEDGVKLDGMIQVGHNSYCGKNSSAAGSSGIGGSCVLGENVYLATGATIKNQCKVGDHAFIGIGAVAMRDVGAGEVVAGNPARATAPISKK